MNVVQFLLEAGEDDALALLTQEGDVTYRQLREAVCSSAAFLLDAGAARGERVAILAENSLFALAAYLGAMHAGTVAVPLPANVSPDACAGIVRSTRARFAFVQSKALPDLEVPLRTVERLVVDEPLAAASGQVTAFAALRKAELVEVPPAKVDAREELAVLLFTSGSTSAPRGVMLSHQNLIANTTSILGYLPLTRGDRAMMVLPFYYSFGASLLHTHLRVGGSLVLDRRFMFPDKVLRRMQETACTGFGGVPSHYQVLLRRSQLKSMQFPDLKWFQQAGGKLPGHFIQELCDAFPAVRIYIMYGATEATARLSCLLPELLSTKLGSVGRPIPGVTLELLDEAGVAVAPGEVGEIVARGENVARGYWDAPQETEATFREGRLHTGDLARMDRDGCLFIVDRAKDFIKCAGNRTSTKMLEEVLLQFPEIVEAAVLGVPDDTLGEAVAIWVVPRGGLDPTLTSRLLTFAGEKLAPHLVPRQVTVVTALPKNNAGKVIKAQLRSAV